MKYLDINYKIKYQLPLYIGSLITVWSSDAVGLKVVNNKHQKDKPLLMSRYMTVFHTLFLFLHDQQ